MKPRVVHIIDRLPPDGAERLLCDVLRYRSDAFEFEVLCLVEGGPFMQPLLDMGVPVTVLGKRRGIDPVMMIRLLRWLRRRRPAVVHTHLFTADTWGRLAAWLTGVPVLVSTVHSVNSWQRGIHRLVDRLLARITTRLIACTPQVESKLVWQDRIPATRVVTLVNGVDLARFRHVVPVDVRREFGFTLDAPVAAIVGRLEKVKGQFDFLKVLARLRDHGHDLNLLLLGDGPMRARLEAEIERLRLADRVRLAGFRRDIDRLLADVDMVLIPSWWEGLPMALLEAMALARPVVAHAVGGIPDVIRHEREGLLVRLGARERMEQAVIRLLEDPALRRTLGDAARERVRARYSAQQLSAEYEQLYRLSLPGSASGEGVQP